MLKKKKKNKSENRNGNQIKRNPFLVKKEGGLRFDALHRFRHWWVGGRSLTRSIFRITAACLYTADKGRLYYHRQHGIS